MIELLLNYHVPRVRVVRIVGFIAFPLGEVYLAPSLISLIPTAASSAVVIIAVKAPLRPSPGVLLESFGHTVLLKVAYFIASPAPNINTSSWPSGRILLLFLLP